MLLSLCPESFVIFHLNFEIFNSMILFLHGEGGEYKNIFAKEGREKKGSTHTFDHINQILANLK